MSVLRNCRVWISPLRRQSSSSLHSNQEIYLDERLMVVDFLDRPIGETSKRDAHHKNTMSLHRAFSVFAFTPSGELILQKRSDSKITFPSLWTNTCCSHPLVNSETERDGVIGVKCAAVRKLEHELNLKDVRTGDLSYMGRFLYEAPPLAGNDWGEHEMDYALVLRDIAPDRVSANPDEVSDIRFVREPELREWIHREPSLFSPWFSLFFRLNRLSEWWSDVTEKNNVREVPPDYPIVRMN